MTQTPVADRIRNHRQSAEMFGRFAILGVQAAQGLKGRKLSVALHNIVINTRIAVECADRALKLEADV